MNFPTLTVRELAFILLFFCSINVRTLSPVARRISRLLDDSPFAANLAGLFLSSLALPASDTALDFNF